MLPPVEFQLQSILELLVRALQESLLIEEIVKWAARPTT
jgi:hypothetical protein